MQCMFWHPGARQVTSWHGEPQHATVTGIMYCKAKVSYVHHMLCSWAWRRENIRFLRRNTQREANIISSRWTSHLWWFPINGVWRFCLNVNVILKYCKAKKGFICPSYFNVFKSLVEGKYSKGSLSLQDEHLWWFPILDFKRLVWMLVLRRVGKISCDD